MKEFIDKLISRLEEEHERCINRYGVVGGNLPASIVKRCIEIVNQLFDEYQRTVDQTDYANIELYAFWQKHQWIPCSERLPELLGNTSETVLVCSSDGFQNMAFWCSDEKWRFCESGLIKEPMDWAEIIAWQPLPAPYQPKD